MDYIIKSIPKNLDNVNLNYIQNIENKIAQNISLTEEEANNFLDYVVFFTRKEITKDGDDSFLNKCDQAQNILSNYFHKLNIPNYANSTLTTITSSIVGHNFNCIKLNVNNTYRYYLIDPTYRQFFIKDKCQENNYIIHDNKVLKTPYPGFFISKEDYPIISEFLSNGYMEMTKENVKIYGDSFFKTKQGVPLENMKYYKLPGEAYMKLFLNDENNLEENYPKRK